MRDEPQWKFNVGDRVRARESGRTGRVTSQFVSRASRPMYRVEFDTPLPEGQEEEFAYGEGELEKAH